MTTARSNTGYGLSAGVLAVVLLSGCSILQSTGTTAASSNAGQTTAERLAALEAGLQQLAQRVDTLQVHLDEPQQGMHSAAMQELPLEQQPQRPGIVLASHPPSKSPAPAAAPPAPVRQPVEPAPAAPVAPPREGDWVINLASYVNAAYATRKQAEFADEGVPVEQVEATVNGKTIYRLCVPGFTTSRAAKQEAGNIQTRLGLQDTWVARR